MTYKKWSSCVFLQTLGAIFARTLRDFSQILPGFLTKQNFWGWICTPASYTTVQQ